jgi:pyruvate,orthophosphate dikinase
VPPGFTITTEACNDYFAAGEKLPDGLWDDVLEAVKQVEQETGKGFGDPANPLLVSVRSGAKFSMPGMMDTVLNLGLNEQTLHGLIALTGNERFGWDAYRRFIQMFGRIVMGVEGSRFDEALEKAKHDRGADLDTDLDAAALRELSAEFRQIVKQDTGQEFPADPYQQLDLAMKAVFASWFGKRARDYRDYNKIAHDLGTCGQRRDHGLWQHGRRLGHGRRLHARPQHRREAAVRRVPDQCPGRGRRRRHPHPQAHQRDA